VVSGLRHVGILKALGFAPRQVVAVYLTIVSVPAAVDSVLGTLLGHLGAGPLLTSAFRGLGVGEVGVSPWVGAAALTEALLRSLPGTVHVTANLGLSVTILGRTQPVSVSFLRGDAATLGFQEQLVAGRWERAGEAVVPSQLLNQRGLAVGDRMTLELGGGRTTVTVVGESMAGGPGGEALLTAWQTLSQLAPGYRASGHEILYQIELSPGTHHPDYLAAVAAADPGLHAWDNTSDTSSRSPWSASRPCSP
jgi:hypothetical protein